MSIFVALLDGRKSITLSKDQRCRLSRCGRCEAMLRPAPCQEFPNQRSGLWVPLEMFKRWRRCSGTLTTTGGENEENEKSDRPFAPACRHKPLNDYW
jgi:hypothetical protein